MLLLLSIFILQVSSASAKKIMVKDFSGKSLRIDVNGNINLINSVTNQANSYKNSLLPDNLTKNYHNKSYNFANDSQLKFKAKLAKGSNELSLNSQFQMNVDSKKRKENPFLDQLYLSSKSNIGSFDLGNVKAVNQKLKLGPAKLAKGAGGINGKYLEYVNLPMLADYRNSINGVCQNNINDAACNKVKTPNFILLTQSPIGHGGYGQGINSYDNNNSFSKNSLRSINDNSFDGMEDAFKISYLGPELSGLKLGVSYTPNADNNGFTNNADNVGYPQFRDIISLAANYSNYLENGIKIGLSSTLEKGSAKLQNHHGLLAYDIAGQISYFGFDVALSYGAWKDYGSQKDGINSCQYNPSLTLLGQDCSLNVQNYKEPYYFSYGLAYKFGPLASSITALSSNFEENQYQAWSFGIDYKLKRNLITYFEATKFKFESNQPNSSDILNQHSISSNNRQLRDNDGIVLLTGIHYSF